MTTRSLRKKSAGISVTYSGGNFSNNLIGAEFELEESEGCACLSINLASNLSVRNKAVNCYADACELAEDKLSLASVQIDEGQVIDGLIAAKNRNPVTRWELKLLLGEKGAFTYSVEPEMVNGSIVLKICDV